MICSRSSRPLARAAVLVGCAGILATAGCRQDMHDQPKVEPMERSAFFADARASRPLVRGTVARGHLGEDRAYTTGRGKAGYLDTFPMPVTRALLERGRKRYDIYCSPCHDRTGHGNGMIVQRGFPPPPNLHEQRLREAEAGYLVHVIALGQGRMLAYAEQVAPDDRWAIAAYIKALQLAQNARLSDAPEIERRTLESAHE